MMWKGCLVLVLTLLGSGCVSPGSKVETEARKTPPVQMKEAPPITQPTAPPTVTAEQVTDNNAAQIVQALNRELDYDANPRPAPMPVASPNMTKP